MDNQKSSEGKGTQAAPAANQQSSGMSTGSASQGNRGLGSNGSQSGGASVSQSSQSSSIVQKANEVAAAAGATAEKTLDKAQEGIEKTIDKAQEGIDKAAQAAQPVVDRMVSTAHAGVDKVSDMLSTAQQVVGERSQQLGEKYADLSAQGREYVRNHPGSAMLAAVGVGYVLAKLLGGGARQHRHGRHRHD